MALDTLTTPAPNKLVEENYFAWRRTIETTSISVGMEWSITEDIIVSLE